MAMKPSIALDLYREQIREIVRAHNARNPRVFGSVVHGRDAEGSDLDILVDPNEGMTYFDLRRVLRIVGNLALPHSRRCLGASARDRLCRNPRDQRGPLHRAFHPLLALCLFRLRLDAEGSNRCLTLRSRRSLRLEGRGTSAVASDASFETPPSAAPQDEVEAFGTGCHARDPGRKECGSARSRASLNSGLRESGQESALPFGKRDTVSTPAEMNACPSPALMAWKAIRVVCTDEEQ